MRYRLIGNTLFILMVFCLLNLGGPATLNAKTDPSTSQIQALQTAHRTTTNGNQTVSRSWLALSIFFLLVVVVLVGAYLFFLQKQFLTACREDRQLSLFADKPAGLPDGTIRSALTLLIIIVSLYLFILTTADIVKFPEALAAILSAIIGFYFGHRSSSNKDASLTKHLNKKLNSARAEKDADKAGLMIKKITKNAKLLNTITNLLPEDKQSRFKSLLDRLKKGADAAKELADGGAYTDAAKKAENLYQTFKKSNPLKEIVAKASASFAAAAPGFSPLALVGVSGTLAGVEYNRWKALILDLPFTPGNAPLKPVDKETFSLLMMQNPVMKKAFESKLDNRDSSFLEKAMIDFFVMDPPLLWKTYNRHNEFESLDLFEQGIREFRTAAATIQIENEIDPALFAKVGGFKKFMVALNKIKKSPRATADLDMLMEVVDGLKITDEPMINIFKKVKKEVDVS